jgi:hypothetical protein
VPIVPLNLRPSRGELRWFAALWWPALCAATGWMLFRKFHLHGAAISMWAGGGAVAALGVVAPYAIRPLYLALILLTYPLGWCISHAFLALLYFLVVTPIGVLARLFHDPMTREFEPAEKTYWSSRETSGGDRYFKQL